MRTKHSKGIRVNWVNLSTIGISPLENGFPDMRSIPHAWLSILISIPAATVLAPLLVQVPWFNYFLVYSMYSPIENMFLLTAISTYGVSQLIIYRLRYGFWRAVLHTVVFYFVSAGAVLVLGLVSFALLWVMPMSLLLFNDDARSRWHKPEPINF
jgi:hypothetical protein